ncbi:hypothetical protein TNCV_4179771 [Trichonephila clavipes]|nr:hypothetical protein TNCV_4179771 [Trichonephila clavipes]
MNETTKQEKTTQLISRKEQLNSAAGTKKLNSSVGTKKNSTLYCLQPPASPLQQNRLFLPTNVHMFN